MTAAPRVFAGEPVRALAAALVALALATVWGPGTARAHPFDATFHSARCDVKLDDQRGLRVKVILEVPTAKILEEFLELYGDPTQIGEEASDIFRQRQFERFSKDLRVRVGGRRPAGAWTPTDDPINGLGTAEFFVYMLEYVLEDKDSVMADRVDVRVDLDVFGREPVYFTVTGRGRAPKWKMVSNSADKVLKSGDPELLDPNTGQWSLDPRLRKLRFVFERQEPADKTEG
ncbi:MAG: hypothetical protein AAGN66_12575 [Acidobacteriota bacterium]